MRKDNQNKIVIVTVTSILRQMQMAATAYLKTDDDWNAAQLLLAGFNGTLKLWWENYLNEKERFHVSKSINEEGE